MRRAIMAVVAVLSLVAVAAPGAATRKTIRFTETITGVGIDATHSVFEVKDSHFGSGAGTQVIKLNSSASGGTDREKVYYGDASVISHGTFKLGTPNSSGIASLTGSGQDVGGTGNAKGVKSTYTYSGAYNAKTGLYKVTLKGKYTL